MKKIAALWGLILAMLLSGCGYLGTNAEDLISPPGRDETESLIMKALYDAASEDAELIRAFRGTMQNSVIYHDLDGDGDDEIIVLYRSTQAHPESPDAANILVFSHSESGLEVLFDIVGYGTEIDKLEFADFNGDGLDEIVVGYISAYDDSNKTVYIYRLDFETRMPIEGGLKSYTDWVIVPFDLSPGDDLVFAYRDPISSVVQYGVFSYDVATDFIYNYQQDMYTSNGEIFRMQVLNGRNNDNAVLVSSRYGSMLMTHDILYWNNGLVNMSRDKNGEDYDIPYMKSMYCTLGDYIPSDIDGDGYIDFPMCYMFDESRANKALVGWKEALLFNYSWNTFDPAQGFVYKYDSYINAEQNYIFKIYDLSVFMKIKAYLNFNNDMFFYYVENESDIYPSLGMDRRVLLFSILKTTTPPTENENTFLLYTSPDGEYFTLKISTNLTERQREYLPDIEKLSQSFMPALIVTAQ